MVSNFFPIENQTDIYRVDKLMQLQEIPVIKLDLALKYISKHRM